jgi:hypothetical protein
MTADTRKVRECDEYGCEGVRYYPELDVEKLFGRDQMDTVQTPGRCTECDYDTRASTSPKYMMFRVRVTV